MAFDGQYKNNQQRKDNGGKPFMAFDKDYQEWVQLDTTFAVEAEGGRFRYSEMYKPQSEGDYSEQEHYYPPDPPNPPNPWPPLPPFPPPPNPNPDPSPPKPITEFFDCQEPEGCWCPGVKKCFTMNCTQKIIAAEPIGATLAVVEGRGAQVCITATDDDTDVQVRVIMVKKTKVGNTTISQQADDTVTLKRCPQEECVKCGGETIGYTSLQMQVSGTQTLTVVGAKAGLTYSWSTSAGSVSPSTGTSVTFTAPASNANCTSNPTVTLSCNGAVANTVTFAVNAVSGSGYWQVVSQTEILAETSLGTPLTGAIYFDCDGAQSGNTGPYCYSSSSYCGNHSCEIITQGAYPTKACCNGWSSGACGTYLGQVDLRSGGQKTAGCCPYQVL